MNPLLRRSAAHLFVSSLEHPEIPPADQHHLERVLRLADGEPITLSDGAGSWRAARWSRAAGVVAEGEVVGEPSLPTLTIGCAIPKGDRPELIVQKLTEIGIDRIVLFESARSVVRWDGDKRAKQLDRLQRIAREAAAQSRRVWLPEVRVGSFAELLDLDGVAIAEPSGAERITAATRAVLIGPEGGYDQLELPERVPHVSLAPTVLRVETAAIVAAAGLVAWRF